MCNRQEAGTLKAALGHSPAPSSPRGFLGEQQVTERGMRVLRSSRSTHQTSRFSSQNLFGEEDLDGGRQDLLRSPERCPCPAWTRADGHAQVLQHRRGRRSEGKEPAASPTEPCPAVLEQRNERNQRNEGTTRSRGGLRRSWSHFCYWGRELSQGEGPGPPSVSQVQLDVVFKDGDEQHDGEPQQDAGVLQQEEAAVAEALVARVVVQHLRHLRGTKRVTTCLASQRRAGRGGRGVLREELDSPCPPGPHT